MEQTLRELTDQLTQKDQALQESLQFSNALFKFNPVPMIVTTVPTGFIVKVNKAFVKASGYTSDELIGQTTDHLYLNSEDRVRIINKIKAQGFVFNEEVFFRTKQGISFVGAMYINLVKINAVDHFVSAMIDQTERNRITAENVINREELSIQSEELRRLLEHQEQETAKFKQLLKTYLADIIPKKLLVVDDEKDNLIVIPALLMSHLKNPCIIHTAHNGQLGFELATAHDPDVILLDIKMPGMDGIEACRKIKEYPATSSIPVLFITGYADERDIKKMAMLVGGDGFIVKPIDSAELITQVIALSKVKVLNKIKTMGLLDGQ